jgi:glycoprotein-N-acetylgalactosamine 3-beta-galactosyltransferase
MLAHYNPKTALYFGHRYAVQGLDEGYMAGGGYILSNKALEKFIKLVDNTSVCHTNGGAEDWEMGRCLEHSAIFVDCRDEAHQKRFFPVGAEEHMHKNVDPNYWYTRNQYYHVPQGSPDCCSDTSVGFHYIGPRELYALDYFIYNVHPFGIDDHSNEKFPKKFTLQEVINASDVHSPSSNFKVHQNYHYTEKSEVY